MNESAERESLTMDHAAASAAQVVWPRITMVTAVRNGARFLEDTICSIVDQGYPNLEYIIVDGESTDGTVDIIRRYEKHLSWWTSQRDANVYEALNLGFSRSTGTILGWLNAGDKLHKGGLFVVGGVFAGLEDVEWITGRPTDFAEDGTVMAFHEPPHWSRYRYLAGANRYIQQESTFWRRSLWEKSGGHLDTSNRDSGDCELWVRFFRHAQLYPVDSLIGGYRFHLDAMSLRDREGYDRRCSQIIERELASIRWGKTLKLFRKISHRLAPIPIIRGVWQRLVTNGLYHLPGPDWPPTIELRNGKWSFRKR